MKSIQKFIAVTDIKCQTIFNNMAIMCGPILTLGIVLGLRYLYQLNLAEGETLPTVLVAMILNMGLVLNASMNGFLMVGTAIAEEKEKHTLRVLMTSSVTGIQYFLGTICIPFVIIMILNGAILPLAGCRLIPENVAVYVLLTAISGLTSCIIGMLVGIFAKNQMSANLMATPLLLVFGLIPIFGDLSEGIAKVSRFLFTGVLTDMAGSIAAGTVFRPDGLQLAVLFGEMLLALIIFICMYKRNGYEK